MLLIYIYFVRLDSINFDEFVVLIPLWRYKRVDYQLLILSWSDKSADSISVQFEVEVLFQVLNHIFFFFVNCLFTEHILKCYQPREGTDKRRHKRLKFGPWVRKVPCRRTQQPILVFMLRESHGQRSLVGQSPQGHKKSDMTEETQHTCIHSICFFLQHNDLRILKIHACCGKWQDFLLFYDGKIFHYVYWMYMICT